MILYITLILYRHLGKIKICPKSHRGRFIQKPWVRGKLLEYWAAKPGRGDHRVVAKECDISAPQSSEMVLVPWNAMSYLFSSKMVDLHCSSHTKREVDASSQAKQHINMAIQKWRGKCGKRSLFMYSASLLLCPLGHHEGIESMTTTLIIRKEMILQTVALCQQFLDFLCWITKVWCAYMVWKVAKIFWPIWWLTPVKSCSS